jgi:chaperonin GroES
MKVNVIGKKVLVKEVTEKTNMVGGLIIPDSANNTPRECVIEAVGCGVTDELICTGCTILIPKGAGVDVKIETNDFIIVYEEDIIAVVN